MWLKTLALISDYANAVQHYLSDFYIQRTQMYFWTLAIKNGSRDKLSHDCNPQPIEQGIKDKG